MGQGTVSKLHSAACALITTATAMLLLCACPADEPRATGQALTGEQITAARTDPGWPEEGSIRVWSDDGDGIILRDPLSDENPYLEKYGTWDLWCYRNARNRDDPEIADYFDDNWPEEWTYINATVDKDGWMQPIIPGILITFMAQLGYFDVESGTSKQVGIIYSMGEMDDGLKTDLIQVYAAAKAPYYLPVPAWLADNLPAAAMHLPDGRFALLGEPGVGSDLERFSFYAQDLTDAELSWSIYRADGQLESTGQPGEYWWQLFIPDFEKRTGMELSEVHTQTMQDRVIWFAADASKGGSFAWDGSDQQATLDMSSTHNEGTFDPRYLMVITGPELPDIYATQQTTEPILPCGWGFGVTDLSELDQSLPIATGSRPAGNTTVYIQTKPLDDPGNPYREKYDEWDIAYFEAHERLCRDFSFNPRGLEDDFNTWDFREILLDQGLGRPDQSFGQPYISVDDNGYVIPDLLMMESYELDDLAQAPEIFARIRQDRQCQFGIRSAQFHDDDLEAGLSLAQDKVLAKYLPPIPDWLADNPPLFALTMPEGEYITYGDLGSAAANPDFQTITVTSSDYYAGSEPWFRFDSSGNKLGRVDAGQHWWEIYFPDFQQVIADLGGTEKYSYFFAGGHITVVNRTDGSENYYYTYKGEQVEQQMGNWDNHMFAHILGNHVSAMREIQRELSK